MIRLAKLSLTLRGHISVNSISEYYWDFIWTIFLFPKKKLLKVFCFWTPQKYFPVVVLFHFVSLHYIICWIDRLDLVSDKSSLRYTVLFFSFWQDRGKQSIKEISHPIITNISPWSFWNIRSAGNIWDRSATENFLGVWDSLKVWEFSEDPIANRNSSGFRVLLAFRPRTSWPSISKLL